MNDTKSQKRVEYVPPAPAMIEHYAQNVCGRLAETIDAAFNAPDIAQEFGEFLKAISVMYAKYQNRIEK